jgi:hypothetical protein
MQQSSSLYSNIKTLITSIVFILFTQKSISSYTTATPPFHKVLILAEVRVEIGVMVQHAQAGALQDVGKTGQAVVNCL